MVSRTHAIEFIKQVYQTLADQTDLSPNNPMVTHWCKRFVEFLSATYSEDWAGHLPDAPELANVTSQLPVLCGVAECEMEKWWCRRFVACPDLSFEALAEFWYFENYRNLVAAELSLLGPAVGTRAVLLGSGALPLTAILLAKLVPGLHVQCIDKDPEACELSCALLRRLGIENRTKITHGLAEREGFQSDDLVICASLLQAPNLYAVLAGDGVKTFVTRDAEGLFRLCYRPASAPPIGYSPGGRTTACSSRINISRLFSLLGGPW